MNASPPVSVASAEARNTVALLNAQQVSPKSQIADFRQTQFVFASGQSLDTDWGQVRVDLENIKLRRMLDASGGYLNVVLHDSRLGGPFWVIENLRIPPDSDCRTDGTSSDTLREEQIADPPRKTPMSAHFDLRPGIEGSGAVNRLRAAVLVSTSPLPPILSIWHLIEEVSPEEFRVSPQINNAEGDLGEAPTSTPASTGELLLGPPPQPIVPVPEPPSDFAFPIEVIQYNQPNINAAKNQCVPMADALVIGYLRIRYNHPPLAWPLPHSSSAGLGLQSNVGDVIFWEPEPESSRVAQLDARARRSGVLNFDTGGGTDRCGNIRALFSYMAEEGVPGQIVFRHQGGSATYGAGNSCDNGDVLLPLGGITSTRQGITPTWQWIFDELQQGRGIYMSFGRYDVNGNRTSGHAVRIWGARRFNGRNYIYTLDDGDQGSNNVGLQNTQYEVVDKHTPGMPNVPNGRLELGDTSSEIEFVMSMEAKPTLLVP
ncbi:MAG TPA: hypothetical protein VH744_10510 [Terriglobales bacterium]